MSAIQFSRLRSSVKLIYNCVCDKRNLITWTSRVDTRVHRVLICMSYSDTWTQRR